MAKNRLWYKLMIGDVIDKKKGVMSVKVNLEIVSSRVINLIMGVEAKINTAKE